MLERPENPFVQFGKQLGRDEIYAAILSAVLTAAAYFVISWAYGDTPPLWLTATVLPLIGPLLEKPGLLAHYIGEGIKAWRAEGGPLTGHLKRSLFNERVWRTLRADVLYHDPAYTGLMAAGVMVFAPSNELQAGLLATIAFFGAVTVAALLEVGYVEWRYKRFVAGLTRQGFETEDYVESRYLLVEGVNATSPERILADLAARFDLDDSYTFSYRDQYFTAPSVKGFNHRKAVLRFRDRSWTDGDGIEQHRKSVQAVYTHPGEAAAADVSMYRCFYLRKEKHFKRLTEDATFDGTLRTFKGEASNEGKMVAFTRLAARDPDGLYVSVDTLEGAPASILVELKVRSDLALLKEASDYIAQRYPVAGMTLGKAEYLSEAGASVDRTAEPA